MSIHQQKLILKNTHTNVYWNCLAPRTNNKHDQKHMIEKKYKKPVLLKISIPHNIGNDHHVKKEHVRK